MGVFFKFKLNKKKISLLFKSEAICGNIFVLWQENKNWRQRKTKADQCAHIGMHEKKKWSSANAEGYIRIFCIYVSACIGFSVSVRCALRASFFLGAVMEHGKMMTSSDFRYQMIYYSERVVGWWPVCPGSIIIFKRNFTQCALYSLDSSRRYQSIISRIENSKRSPH